MRKSLILAIAFAIGMLLVAPLSAGEKGQPDRPFYAQSTGVILPFNTNPEHLQARCGDAPDGKVAWEIASFEGTGTGTHLGRFDIYAEHCSYRPLDGPPDGTYGQGMITVTAANGDVLLANYDDGVSYPDGPFIVFMDHVTFVDGGTGRFAFASGDAFEMGTVNFNDFTFAIEVSGSISYGRR